MLSNVGILCFATSYTIVLVLEISRMLFRSGIRGAVMLGFAGVGLVTHSAFLYYQALRAEGSPLSSDRDWYLLAAWLLAVAYLYLVYYHPRAAFGLFLMPLTLGLLAMAALADPEPFARGPAHKAWGMIHGISLVAATAAVLIGFAAGLMYLGQSHRLKHKLPPIRGFRLPSLEWLQRANNRAVIVATLMLLVGIVSGILLNVIDRDPADGRLPWSDPLVWSTGLMFAWVLLATATGVLYRPARRGRKVAYLTVVSFLFLLLALAAGLFLNTQHGGERNRDGSDDPPAVAGEPVATNPTPICAAPVSSVPVSSAPGSSA